VKTEEMDLIIEPPVKGQWAVFNPPGHAEHAFDLLAVNHKKSPYIRGGLAKHVFTTISVENTHTWSAEVTSPVEGILTTIQNDVPDRFKLNLVKDLFNLIIRKPSIEDGFGAFGGNHVMIESGGSFVLLCHLKQGSIQGKVGDTINLHDKLGEVGNSGSSIQPHLHIQVMKGPKFFPLFENLWPFKISDANIKNGGKWDPVTDFELQKGGHYLFG
jgi:hypothetical protein